jgi:hypothetical protein
MTRQYPDYDTLPTPAHASVRRTSGLVQVAFLETICGRVICDGISPFRPNEGG